MSAGGIRTGGPRGRPFSLVGRRVQEGGDLVEVFVVGMAEQQGLEVFGNDRRGAGVAGAVVAQRQVGGRLRLGQADRRVVVVGDRQAGRYVVNDLGRRQRSEGRRVGKEWCRKVRFRGLRSASNKNK